MLIKHEIKTGRDIGQIPTQKIALPEDHFSYRLGLRDKPTPMNLHREKPKILKTE
ncbi:hypothetical protein J2X69_004030 [Algoriphagus sp. 4150]|uniref:hypothetical protein n=1 Tax=Algoriphagus sp. 4150 TaxID=2817756 RepID=UPI00285D5F68|nr:hypothetical protein [Algoriphagus sp. 4150]MDR7131666.1 hypothetical protein [Algoriphagus sp. 4150]